MSKKPFVGCLFLFAGLSAFDLSVRQSVALYFAVAVSLIAITIDRDRYFHPMQFVAIAYVIGYPIASLAYEFMPPVRGAMGIAQAAEQPGMLWALRGFAALSIGYTLMHLRPRRLSGPLRSRARNGKPRLPIRIVGLAGAAAALGMLVKIAVFGVALTFIEQQRAAADSVQGSFAMVLDLCQMLVEPFFAGYVILWRAGTRRAWLDGIAIVLAIFAIGQIVSIGSKAAIIKPLLAVTTGYLLSSARMKTKQMLLLLSAAVAIYMSFSIVTEFRALMHEENRAGGDVFSLSTQVDNFGKAVAASVFLTESAAARETEVGAREITHRLGAPLFGLSNLLYFTRFQPPMESAWESLLAPVYAVLPRALLEKPVFFDSGINASRYYGWTYGGISVSMEGSFYHAWGYPGILIGMAGVGVLLGFVFQRVPPDAISNMPAVLMAMAVLVLAVQPGMAFQSAAISLVRVACAIAVLRWMSKVVWRPTAHEGSHLTAIVRQASGPERR